MKLTIALRCLSAAPEGGSVTLDINDIDETEASSIWCNWTLVTTHDIQTGEYRFAWWNIYRSSDGKLYRVRCWDSAYGSFQPEVQCQTMERPDIEVTGYVALPDPAVARIDDDGCELFRPRHV